MDKEKRKNQNTKPTTLPKKYEQGFLKKLDARTEAHAVLLKSYNGLMADLGGESSLSHITQTLCERFCFLEVVLRNLEKQIIEKPNENESLIAKHTQMLNTFTGLAKMIGIKPKGKKAQSLKAYLNGGGQ